MLRGCLFAKIVALEQATNEMSSLLCKDFLKNPCHSQG
ncbi:hypothetical protein KL86DES1_10259 [uncultured Desulfovibrio sp.]|uniref:Uncharacterized protein n=1 Tax=uncultured Desulfovibrio sp. TaxID=167968 RepID=A0A212KY30_9BACT|nr:hypothetical protein KL86DES1_10259 [uncultured Desulfovibrio sp.]